MNTVDVMRELLRSMVISWDMTEVGAPAVDPVIPYGSANLVDDIMRIAAASDENKALDLHRETEAALCAFLANAQLRPGRYTYPNLLRDQEENGITTDFFAGVDPERHGAPMIDFDLTEEHLKLIRAASVRWNDWEEEFGDVYSTPGIDPKRPYGNMTYFYFDMATALGLQYETPEDIESDIPMLQKLHEDMQAALQVFLKYAE